MKNMFVHTVAIACIAMLQLASATQDYYHAQAEATVVIWNGVIRDAAECYAISGAANYSAPCWVPVMETALSVTDPDVAITFDGLHMQCAENSEAFIDTLGWYAFNHFPANANGEYHDIQTIKSAGAGWEYQQIQQKAYFEADPSVLAVAFPTIPPNMVRLQQFGCFFALRSKATSPTGLVIRIITAVNDQVYGGQFLTAQTFAHNAVALRDWSTVRQGCAVEIDIPAPTGKVAIAMAEKREALRQGLSGSGYHLAKDVLTSFSTLNIPAFSNRFGKDQFTELWQRGVADTLGGAVDFVNFKVFKSEFGGNTITNFVNYRVCDKSDTSPTRLCRDFHGTELWNLCTQCDGSGDCATEFALENLSLQDADFIALPTVSPPV